MIRFAVWAAVSTIDQVEGASLDNQIDKCKERGNQEGWYNTGLVYVADGYSRTGYVNLSDAETDIPPLGKMLSDMRAGLFDVLVVWNYDRLGDLIIMVATEFRNQKKQLFSLAQPTPVQANYNPYMDDSSFIMQALAPIWQKQRIADLRRKWEAGIPRRIKNGLHPGGPVPFGYKKVRDDEPFEIVPSEAFAIKEMARLYLEGRSLRAIAQYCNESSVKTPHNKQWSTAMISGILRNPFYCGIVQWRKERVTNGRRYRNFDASRIKEQGKHQPIFTPAYFETIQAELRRRAERNKKNNIKYPFTGLLYCGYCGQKLYRSGFEPYYYITEPKEPCQSHQYEKLIKTLAEEIQKQSLERRNPREEVQAPQVDFTAEIADIESRIERVQNSAELGVYTPVEAAKRVSALRAELEKIEIQKLDAERSKRAKKEFDESFEELEYMAEWIQSDDPMVVNQILHSVIERVEVYRGGRCEIHWR